MHGERLRKLRERVGISQLDLAEQLGISETMVWRYENKGIEPRADVVIEFAKFFGVSSDYLLGLTNEINVDVPTDSLTPEENALLSALRRGDKIEAIRVIVGG